MSKPEDSKRRNIRFKPDLESIAHLDLDGSHDITDFKVEANALIYDESFTGCGLVAIANDKIAVGKIVIAKIGNLGPVAAEVKWVKQGLDERVILFGLEYIN